jgi:3-hydroxyisobutyrate dehydrogenase
MKLGILGTGRMGKAIAEHLLDLGYTLTVWNRTPAKAKDLVDRGALLVNTPAELANNSDVVISILTDAKAIDTAYSGPNGVLSTSLTGKICIEMSTVRPETQIALAKKIAAQGGALVECPVGGTVTPARDGKLLGLVGGVSADVEKVMPLLNQMCRRVEHVGNIGAGTSLKLAINLPLLVYWQSLAEALSLVGSMKIDKSRILDILSDTSGAPTILKMRIPAILSALSGQPSAGAHFNIDSIRKDLKTMIEEAAASGYSLPVTTAALESFNNASAAGLGNGDGTELAAWWLEHSCQK